MTDNCQAQTEPAVSASSSTFSLAEWIKDVRYEVWPDPLPGIAHDNLDMRINPLDAHLHASIARREFDGIGKKIPDDLLQTAGIPGDGSRIRIERGFNPDSFSLGRRYYGTNRGFYDCSNHHGAHIKTKLSCNHAGYIKQVFDELSLSLGI